MLIFSYTCFSQDDPFAIKKHPFIDLSQNEFQLYDCEASYENLFGKFTKIALNGSGKVSIVHIGDSHIQADFFSGNIRSKLQTFFVGSQNGRGFVFPYKVAKTNNPLSYKVKSKGEWQNCRNVQSNLKCKLGLSGIAVITTDEQAEIEVNIADKTLPGYDFNQLMVFHEFAPDQYDPIVIGASKITPHPDKGYTLFEFDKNRENIRLQLQKTEEGQHSFNLYGLNFESTDGGIVYHTIGINGARFDSYLKCEYFVPHLHALKPDWVIVSLGTNDVYTNAFNAEIFRKNVLQLIGNVKQSAPNASILLTLPGDHLMKRVYTNESLSIACSILVDIAKQEKISVWDFYTVMGGNGSIEKWRYAGLAHTDFLHYTENGYIYQGQLFFNAFIKAYDTYLTQEFQ